jgi:hypothetical protein
MCVCVLTILGLISELCDLTYVSSLSFLPPFLPGTYAGFGGAAGFKAFHAVQDPLRAAAQAAASVSMLRVMAAGVTSE